MRYVFACGFRINVQENHNSMISDPRMIDDAADCVCYAVEYAYTIDQERPLCQDSCPMT